MTHLEDLSRSLKQLIAAVMNELPENELNMALTCRFCLNKNRSDLTAISDTMDVYCNNQAINLEHVVVVCCSDIN